jgi:hypothetical protein
VVKKESLDLPDHLVRMEQLVRLDLPGLLDLRVLLELLQTNINHSNRGIFSKKVYTLLHLDEGTVDVRD